MLKLWEDGFVTLIEVKTIWVGACLDTSVDKYLGGSVEGSELSLAEQPSREVALTVFITTFFFVCHHLGFL